MSKHRSRWSESSCSLCSERLPEPFRAQGRTLRRCGTCGLIAVAAAEHLDRDASRARYRLHRNNAQDAGFIRFLEPVVDCVRRHVPAGARLLDFGCGAEPGVLADQFSPGSGRQEPVARRLFSRGQSEPGAERRCRFAPGEGRRATVAPLLVSPVLAREASQPMLARLLTERGFEVDTWDPLFDTGPAPPAASYRCVVCTEVVEHFTNPAEDWDRLAALVAPGGVLVVMTLLVSPSTDLATWWYLRDPTHVAFHSAATIDWIARRHGLEILESDGARLAVLRRAP